ncbi:DUF5777 family beta-barrel protein [Chryseosolibacter indicus]|uniref:DUF5777 domain-containing protein n=1 Tax=Chryseosolibacter indicus TaxID=2782351 RepID=A0ABS5VS18_9BACT|nr:DUF5777 family beta-barrel protein [Chryseosolibacter indicus]MBT1703649.1 hypothetical protein [Chryseosolibacter indicus]
MKKHFLIVLALFFGNYLLMAQDDLMKELEQSQDKDTEYAFQTFKGTRLVNGHTIETKNKGTLEFIFAHRFGPVNGGLYELFGLDDAYVRLGLDYGITDNLSVSIGRNSVDKTMDGYVKYKLLRQSKGARNFPLTITALGGTAYKTSPKKEDALPGFENVHRLAYVGQLLIARKITPSLSLQIMPSFVHRNAVNKSFENNDDIAIGAGGRIKLTKSVAFTSEYYYRLNVPDGNPYKNTLGFGIDIETGGHVFQIVMTNTRGLTERAFLTETEGDFGDGDIHFGFNVTRTFQLKRK